MSLAVEVPSPSSPLVLFPVKYTELSLYWIIVEFWPALINVIFPSVFGKVTLVNVVLFTLSPVPNCELVFNPVAFISPLAFCKIVSFPAADTSSTPVATSWTELEFVVDLFPSCP